MADKIIDRATALALRRTTRAAKQRARVDRTLELLACPPTIRAIELPLCSPDPRVEVLIIAPKQAIWVIAIQWIRRVARAHALDRAWLTAFAVAVSATLALAIPLELLRQHG